MNKIFKYLSYLTILLALGLMFLFGYWFLYPYQPLTIFDPVFPVVNKQVRRGELLQFISNNCKNVEMTAQTTRAFIDDTIFYTPTITTNVRKGCGKVVINVPVPDAIPLGEYYIQNIFQYKVNPIRTISVIHDTERFEVIK